MQLSTFFLKQVQSPPGCRAKLEAQQAQSALVWEEGGGSPSGPLIWGERRAEVQGSSPWPGL